MHQKYSDMQLHFFIKTESESVHGYIESLFYRESPIIVGELEIPLRLTFSCPKEDTITLMRDFLITQYSWTFTDKIKEDSDSEEGTYIMIRIKDE